MSVCPATGPDDPLVQSLLALVDCNVETLVTTGYSSLFQPNGAFADVLTVLLTVYVALVGYRLLLGRAQLNVTDFALTAVKLGAVVALATQWSAYQTLVYHFLFYGPQQVADVILHGLRANGSVVGGDVFDGLQRAFTDMTAFSPATPPGAPATTAAPNAGALAASGLTAGGNGQLSTLLSKAGFDSLLLLGSAVLLLVSSLGVLLASKIVLGLLLATGPIFIALLLFETTQGVFEGWLRASLAFAFAPLAVTLLLGLALTLLDPSLQQLEVMAGNNTYQPGVAFEVAVLVVVFSGVAIGMVAAGGMIAAGLRTPRARRAAVQAPVATGAATGLVVLGEPAVQARAARVASAVVAQSRRDAQAFATPATAVLAGGATSSDRRTVISTTDRAGPPAPVLEARLGQQTRRGARPKAGRSGARSEGALRP